LAALGGGAWVLCGTVLGSAPARGVMRERSRAWGARMP
jgi:hypothetical protein